jgi:flagellar hook-associated protein 1
MNAYEQAMEVVQNDTVNANTPGFVAQNVNFSALPFSVNGAQSGGVEVAGVISSRDEYAETNVQIQQSAANYSSTLSSVLGNVQPLFNLQDTTGIAGSLNTLFADFSSLSTTPNSTTAREAVISDAGGVASAFNTVANGLATAVSTVNTDTQNTVTDINNTLADIANLNAQISSGSQSSPDPSVDARMYSDLETLSQYVGITTQTGENGAINVYLAGQRPLVVGSNAFSLSAHQTSSGTVIQDSNGNDITSFVQGGTLGALVQIQNTTLPGYESQLNTLAQGVADQINTQLESGVDQNGNSGTALFTYTAGQQAQSLAVTNITASQIAAASSANPGGNDNALALANLQNQSVAALGNTTSTDYFSNLSTQVGTDVSNATNTNTTDQSLLAQAQSLRSQASSVSLDDEAAKLEQYQQSYDAISKLISAIDDMTTTLMDLMPAPSAL